jgi:hypothetical protein
MSVIEFIVYGWMLHFIADWFFQNDWMARNKSRRRTPTTATFFRRTHIPAEHRYEGDGTRWWDRHPSLYVHAAIHTAIQLVIFPWWGALAIGISHFFLDTRTPLEWWGRLTRQTADGPFKNHVAIWRDQVAHLAAIVIVAQVCGF